MKSANIKWRQFKTYLTRNYIIKCTDDPVQLNTPPKEYNLSQEDWTAFVLSRMTDTFKKLSNEQTQRTSKCKHPHRLAHKGYAGLAAEKEEFLGDDPELNRAILWKLARQNKDGEYEGEGLEETIKRVDTYIDMKKEGKFKGSVLDTALGMPKHSGRVRGMGCNVTKSSMYTAHNSKGSNQYMSSEHVKELLAAKAKIAAQDERIAALEDEKKKNAEQTARIAALVEEEKRRNEEQIARIALLESQFYKRFGEELALEEKGSCSIKLHYPQVRDEETPVNEVEDICIIEDDHNMVENMVGLRLESSNDVVAYAAVVPSHGPQVLGRLDPADSVCVSIYKVEDEKAILPYPIPGECYTIGDAIGTHVAWPTRLIVDGKEKTQKMKKNQQMQRKFSGLPRSLNALFCYASHALASTGKTISIPIEVEVFGVDYTIYVDNEDIIHVCDLSPISGMCISAYIWHLYVRMKEISKLDRFTFMNFNELPYISNGGRTEEAKAEDMDRRSRVLADRLNSAKDGQLVLVPLNIGYHWILTVINPEKEIVYYIDPLSHRIRDATWKLTVNTACKLFNMKKERRGRKQPSWEIVRAPLQPDSKQCGFFVIRYMRDIIENLERNDMPLHEIFTKDDYTRAHIDEVRSKWADIVQDYVFA